MHNFFQFICQVSLGYHIPSFLNVGKTLAFMASHSEGMWRFASEPWLTLPHSSSFLPLINFFFYQFLSLTVFVVFVYLFYIAFPCFTLPLVLQHPLEFCFPHFPFPPKVLGSHSEHACVLLSAPSDLFCHLVVGINNYRLTRRRRSHQFLYEENKDRGGNVKEREKS